jgi:hypothetical protein
MNSILSSTALIALAGVLATAPAVENTGNRPILYWVIIPSLVVAVAAICSHMAAF